MDREGGDRERDLPHCSNKISIGLSCSTSPWMFIVGISIINQISVRLRLRLTLFSSRLLSIHLLCLF